MIKTDDLKIMVEEIKQTDDTTYLEIMTIVDNLEAYGVRDYLYKLVEQNVQKLSDAQVYTLFAMQYKGGNGFNSYYYGSNSNAPSPFEIRNKKVCNNNKHNYYQDTTYLLQDDLKYVSQYHRNQWKKANSTPVTRVTKGLDAQIAMNDFSLIMFKEAITKTFNQTEAKNYVLSVNKAFGSSNKLEEIKIRNKFYKVILDNTPTHSKAMLNEIRTTTLVTNKRLEDNTVATYHYSLEADEAVAIYLGWDNDSLACYSTSDSHSTYASDLNIVTSNTNITAPRDQYRYATAASILMTMFVKTGNQVYKDKADTMVNSLSEDVRNSVLNQTEAIRLLNNTIKQGTINE